MWLCGCDADADDDRLTSSFIQVDFELTHAEVGYSHVTVVIKQHVVELQVTVGELMRILMRLIISQGIIAFLPINDSLSVQKFEARNNLRAVELRSLFGEASALLDVKH